MLRVFTVIGIIVSVLVVLLLLLMMYLLWFEDFLKTRVMPVWMWYVRRKVAEKVKEGNRNPDNPSLLLLFPLFLLCEDTGKWRYRKRTKEDSLAEMIKVFTVIGMVISGTFLFVVLMFVKVLWWDPFYKRYIEPVWKWYVEDEVLVKIRPSGDGGFEILEGDPYTYRRRTPEDKKIVWRDR